MSRSLGTINVAARAETATQTITARTPKVFFSMLVFPALTSSQQSRVKAVTTVTNDRSRAGNVAKNPAGTEFPRRSGREWRAGFGDAIART
jgi:hypothetical protein